MLLSFCVRLVGGTAFPVGDALASSLNVVVPAGTVVVKYALSPPAIEPR